MVIEIEDRVLVPSPLRSTFRFAARPENMPLWNPVVLESRVVGRLRPGAEVVQRIDLFGRRFDAVFAVTSYEPFRRVAYASRGGPVDVRGTMEFETERAGTLIRWIVCGDCRGFFRVTEAVMVGLGRRQMRICLENLRRALQATRAA
jgi:hypothetical protein